MAIMAPRAEHIPAARESVTAVMRSWRLSTVEGSCMWCVAAWDFAEGEGVGGGVGEKNCNV